jgi:DNA-binding NarL/FixJ family response regulator
VTVAGHPVISGIVRVACGSIDGVAVVAESSTFAGAMELIEQRDPDVLVVDLELPDGDGLDLAAAVARTSPHPRIIVLSDRTDGMTVLAALGAGVEAFVPRSEGLRGFADVLRRVIDGETVVPTALETAAAEDLGRFAAHARESAAAEVRLTARERAVLELLADGLTLRQIARRLGLSPRTIESHVTKAYRKLRARSRVQAVSRAARYGLIELH